MMMTNDIVNSIPLVIVIIWTLIAAIGIVPFALYGVWEAVRDLRAPYKRAAILNLVLDVDAVQAAWWHLSVAALYVIIGLTDTVVGYVAFTNTPRYLEIGSANVLSYYFNAFVFLSQEIFTLVSLHYGLTIRRQLGKPRRVKYAKKIRITKA